MPMPVAEESDPNQRTYLWIEILEGPVKILQSSYTQGAPRKGLRPNMGR